MAYSEAARALRRCKATRKDGQQCSAWALWGTEHCSAHTYQVRGKRARPWETMRSRALCTCGAYAWPHRPGSGLCRWPQPPAERCATPTGAHAWWRPGRANAYVLRGGRDFSIHSILGYAGMLRAMLRR